ncbi:MAG TPA: PTS IIA-like nitrogen-regulatory protein PtsN [Devosia sp.]|nr:PTS IIA-like nitrogen-regulatory protein PtsN [Devosia sp.]
MELADILLKDCVVGCAKVTSKRQLLQLFAQKAHESMGLDAQLVFETLMNREKLGSTGLGNGIAIPHGKIAGLSRVLAVFVRLDTPIEFDSVDDQPVDLAMMLLAPEGAGADHLKALARVARLLRTESLVESLRNSRECSEIHALLTAPLSDSAAA